jgi:NAD(P)-dependent dehydrogenase (short-subunit alcohol dehydrogenase family)
MAAEGIHGTACWPGRRGDRSGERHRPGHSRGPGRGGLACHGRRYRRGAARETAAQLAGSGVEAVAAECDVTDREAVEALASKAWAHFGHVDIAVNNAGVFPPIRRAINVDERDARWVLEVNLMGTWYCSAFGRRFTEQGTPAHILNTGSENSLGVAHAGAAFYTASKHAVLGLSDVLRQELPDFIGVSILCPGMVATNLASSARHRPERFGGAGPEVRSASMGLDPADIGRAAVEGIRRGDFYIVTHPPVREIVAERAAEILAAFDAQAPRYPGDEAIDTRAVMSRPRTSAEGRS